MFTTVASPFGAGSDTRTRLVTAGTAPFGNASESTRPTSLPLAQICVAGRRGIDKLRFEVRPVHCHEVPSVGPAERPVHALSLLQRRIGDLDGAKNRLAADRVEGTETDCDRRMGRDRRTLERDVVKRERAGKFPKP